MAYHYNQIASGYNNLSGLTNPEGISVNGNYFLPANDRNFEHGQRITTGNGNIKYNGSPSTIWQYEYLSDAQIWYLSTWLLNGKTSGPVTIRTWYKAVPTATGMIENSIIANAVLTLPTPRTGARYDGGDGYNPAELTFTNIEVIMSDQLYGEIYTTGGSTAQTAIGTTPVKMTGFATDGLYNGVTVSNSGDSLTVIVNGKYKAIFECYFTSTVATDWTFFIYKNGATTNSKRIVLAANKIVAMESLILSLVNGDVITVYVNSDDAGGTATLTPVEAKFSLESVSLV